MRKLLAVFFLFLFAFNVGGYYLIFWGLQYHAHHQLEARADTGSYKRSDEVTFRIRLALPYTLEQEDFTRVNGNFEHDGEFYQIIKQKIIDGQVILVCLKNHQQKKITRALFELAHVNNLPGDTSNRLQSLAKLFKDFQSSPLPILHAGNAWSQEIGTTQVFINANPPCVEITAPPPRLS